MNEGRKEGNGLEVKGDEQSTTYIRVSHSFSFLRNVEVVRPCKCANEKGQRWASADEPEVRLCARSFLRGRRAWV